LQDHQPSVICPVTASVAPKCVWRPGSARTRGRNLQRSQDPVAGFRKGWGKGKLATKIIFFDTTWNLYLNYLRHFARQRRASSGLWSRDVDEEHRKEVESISNRTFTRSDRKSRAAEMNKSATTDHVAKENHVINWSGAKILERGHRKTRQVKESIWILKEPTCMNRDGGAYSLSTAYDRLLVTCSTSTSRDRN